MRGIKLGDHVVPESELIENFIPKIDKDEDSGCWLWTGKTQSGKYNYGYLYINGHTLSAHRLSFAWRFHDPEDDIVHHTCENPRCVNPSHLELLDHVQHAERHGTADPVPEARTVPVQDAS